MDLERILKRNPWLLQNTPPVETGVSADVTAPYTPELAERAETSMLQEREASEISMLRDRLTSDEGMDIEEFRGLGLDEELLREKGVLKGNEVIDLIQGKRAAPEYAPDVEIPLHGFSVTTPGEKISEGEIEWGRVGIRKPSRAMTPIETMISSMPEGIHKDIISTVNAPLFNIAGVDVSAPDIAGIALITYGGYQAAKIGWDAFLKLSVGRNLDSWSKSAGIELPKDTKSNMVTYLYARLPKKWLSQQAIKTLFRPTKVGVQFKDANVVREVNEEVTALVKQYAPQITKFTATNVGIPGQTITQAEIIKGMQGIVPETAEAIGKGRMELAKEPWQMTQAEYIKKNMAERLPPSKKTSALTLGARADQEGIMWFRLAHQHAVGKALSEGKPVPPEVLKYYPELAKAGEVEKPKIDELEIMANQVGQAAAEKKIGTTPYEEGGRAVTPAKEAERVPAPVTPEVTKAPPKVKDIQEKGRVAPNTVKTPIERRNEVQVLIKKPAKELPKGTTKVELRQELAKLNKEILPQEKALRQQIMGILNTRGIPASQYRTLFREKGGNSYLTNINYEGLDKILARVKTVRPKSIRGKHVVTEGTEKAIQSLKNELVSQGKFSEDAYQRLMDINKLKTDKYEYSQRFITESEGKELIRAMNREAEVGLIEHDTRVAEALKDKPELSSVIDGIKGRITKSLPPKDVGVSPLYDMPIYMQRLQERTESRIYDVYKMAKDITDESDRKSELMDEVLEKITPKFKTIAKDKKALERINQYIASQNKMGPEMPEDITDVEILIADQISKDLFSYENDVRFFRFTKSYYKRNGNVDLIQDDIPNAPREDIKESIKFYETKGAGGLREYLDTKDWGVIKSGYEPHIAINPKIQAHRIKATVMGSGRLKSREGVDFAPHEKNILQRRAAYIRQMENLKLEPYFREIDRIFQNDVATKLKNTSGTAHNIEMWMQEAKGYYPQEIFAVIAMRLAGFSFSTLALSPHMFIRNLFQNPALHPDVGVFFDPRNRILAPQEQEYVKTYVSQFKAVMKEWLMQEGMGNTAIERALKKISYYGKSDQINRDILAVFASLNKAERALFQYQKDGNVKKFIDASGMNDMSHTEQVRVLELLAQDKVGYGLESIESVTGGEAAVREIANFVTTRTHFRYKRRDRAPLEMGISGRILGNLATFPRSVAQKMYLHFEKLRPGSNTSPSMKRRALKSLIAAAVGMYLAGETYRKVTGKKRNPYDLFSMLMGWSPGGLATGSIEAATAVMNDINGIMHGEEWAMDNLVKDVPRAADMFILFYGRVMDILEVATEQQYLDRKILRQVKEIFDKTYELNSEFYEKERNWYEAIQHALFAGEASDPTINEVALESVNEAIAQLGGEDTLTKEKALANASIDKRLELEDKDWNYTMSDLGADIGSATYKLEPDMRTTDEGFNKLVEYYWSYKEQRDYYYDELTSAQQKEYKDSHPEFVADMVIWGTWSTIYDDETEARIRQLMEEYEIPPSSIPALKRGKEEGNRTTKPSYPTSFEDILTGGQGDKGGMPSFEELLSGIK